MLDTLKSKPQAHHYGTEPIPYRIVVRQNDGNATTKAKSVRLTPVLARDRTGKAICVRSTAKMPGKDTGSPNSVRSGQEVAHKTGQNECNHRESGEQARHRRPKADGRSLRGPSPSMNGSRSAATQGVWGIRPPVSRRLLGTRKVLSNRLLEDLELLWQLRDSIPDPCNFQD